MKKIYILLFLAFGLYNLNGQTVSIPDANFVNFLTLKYPGCMSGNQLDTTCVAITSATGVDCRVLSIADLEGIQYFDSLDTLKCSSNLLTGLPNLPATMRELYCDSNQIITLPALPAGLIKLSCYANHLSTLPPLPTTLKYVRCHRNQLTSLPTLPNTLLSLEANENQLTALPSLPPNLFNLHFDLNLVSTVPALPAALVSLYSGDNPINSLPALPTKLSFLVCNNNLLTSLPALPDSLRNLFCSNNMLTSLPTLPAKMETIGCDFNLLNTLPALPNTINSIYCNDNQLTFLPDLPDSLYGLNVSNNPNLSCLPRLKRIVYLTINNTNIQCIPNFGTITNSTPALSTFSLCNVFNTNGCDSYWNISGKVYNDLNSNCLDDTTEAGIKNAKVMLYSSGNLIQQTYTGSTGLYSFDTDTGSFTYTIDTAGMPVYLTCPPSGFHTSILTPADSIDFDMNFGVECKPGFDIGALGMHRSRQFFPGNQTELTIHAGDISNYFGLHCAGAVSGTVTVNFNGPVTFVSASAGALQPTVTGSTLVYTVSDFGLIDFSHDFKIILLTDTSAQVADSVCFNVTVDPIAGDIDSMNNYYGQCFAVSNSYDPNLKEVNPTSDIGSDQQWLNYTVYFQNTGTAAAQNIYIIDTLSNFVDPSSFTLLSYSNKNFTQINGNIVRFNFPNINLPDSTNDEPHSHGFIQYKVRSLQGLSIGTTISNTAHIYFDFNSPISTNTTMNNVSNLISVADFSSDFDYNIYPNPVNSETRIRFSLNKSAEVSIQLYNSLGEKIMNISENKFNPGNNEIKFSVAGLAKGIYYIKFKIGESSTMKKIIKL